jgi:hypothetical protein
MKVYLQINDDGSTIVKLGGKKPIKTKHSSYKVGSKWIEKIRVYAIERKHEVTMNYNW